MQLNPRIHQKGYFTLPSPPRLPAPRPAGSAGSAAASAQPERGQKPPRPGGGGRPGAGGPRRCGAPGRPSPRPAGAARHRTPREAAPAALPGRFLFTPVRSRAGFERRGRAHAAIVLSAGKPTVVTPDACTGAGGRGGGAGLSAPCSGAGCLLFPGRQSRVPAVLPFFSRGPSEARPAVPGVRQPRSPRRAAAVTPGPRAPAPLTLHVVQLGPLLLQLALQALGLIFQRCQGLVLAQPLGCHLCKRSGERDEMRARGRRSLLAWVSGMLLRLLLPQQRRPSRPGLPPPPHADVQGQAGCSSSPACSQHLGAHRAEKHPRETAALARTQAERQHGRLGTAAGLQAGGLTSPPPPTHRLPLAGHLEPFSQPKGFVSPEICTKACFCFVPKLLCTRSCMLGGGGGGGRD